MKKVLQLFLVLWFVDTSANNLDITNVTLTGQDTGNDFTLVQLDLSWDNSWRLGSDKDAAWIFIKYRIGSNGVWNHASINYVDGTAANDGHTEATGSTIVTPSDGTGIFIYRNADGTGTNSFTTIQLRWNYGTDGVGDDDFVSIQVFGIEMVYVPTGTFAAGSGGTGTNEFTLTTINTGLATTDPTGSGSLGGQAGGYPTDETAPGNDIWPNGYNAFYCMKYEMSQDQYTDFLNTLTRTQQQTRTGADISADAPLSGNIYVMSNTSVVSLRNAIVCPASGNGTVDPITFSTSTPDLACNYLSWYDGAAYGDWAGLRPMTDLEFEKACRGTATPVADEYAWGTTNIHASSYTLTSAGTSTESISDMGTGTGNAVYTTTDGATSGPKRNGIMAASATNNTREETGAASYGIMEMSGNVMERMISIGSGSGRNFKGFHGDGSLDSDGVEDVTSWPPFPNGFRGGSWTHASSRLTTSDRTNANATTTARLNYLSFRLVRTAP